MTISNISAIYFSQNINKNLSVSEHGSTANHPNQKEGPRSSKVLPLRDGVINMISRGEETAKALLEKYKLPSVGGLMLGSLPDLSDPEAMARRNRITEEFYAIRDTILN